METVGASVLGFAPFTAVAITDIPSVRMLNSSGTPGRRLEFLRLQFVDLARNAANFIECDLIMYGFLLLRFPNKQRGATISLNWAFSNTSRPGPSPPTVSAGRVSHA